MHTDIPIIINITVALSVALIGGYLARLIRLPSLVGYLFAGMVIGPFTPGFVGDMKMIQQLAELGVIFLLFGVGLHFSLKDLWAARRVAILGAIIQMCLTTFIVYEASTLLGWSSDAGIILGLALSIASTVVLIKNLMDRNLLQTSEGKIAVAWLIMEDLATVVILVLLPAITSKSDTSILASVGIALAKSAGFTLVMLVVGTRIFPYVLKKVAQSRSREMFIVTVMVITLGSAVSATAIFDVSLALGAFIAGVVVSETIFKHQVEVEALSFRETFGVLFFVSVGMLVDPMQYITEFPTIMLLMGLILVGKFVVTFLTTYILSSREKTALIVSVALTQIGEFSFLLGHAGVAVGAMTTRQYSLLLSAAILSIIINPFLFRLIPRGEVTFLRRLRGKKQYQEPVISGNGELTLRDHIVVVGYGRIGKHLVTTLQNCNMPMLAIEYDMSRIELLEKQSIPYLYGDAGDSEILHYAFLKTARCVVVTVPDDVSAAAVTAFVRSEAPDVPVIARSATRLGAETLLQYGATKVVYPELVGSLELTFQTLRTLGYEEDEIKPYMDKIRHLYKHILDPDQRDISKPIVDDEH
jgi:CPA2 family monovalent cation:H+ antiporter-2